MCRCSRHLPEESRFQFGTSLSFVPEPHNHEAAMDDKGEGGTTKAAGHRHDIVGGEVQSAEGHTHTLIPAEVQRGVRDNAGKSIFRRTSFTEFPFPNPTHTLIVRMRETLERL